MNSFVIGIEYPFPNGLLVRLELLRKGTLSESLGRTDNRDRFLAMSLTAFVVQVDEDGVPIHRLGQLNVECPIARIHKLAGTQHYLGQTSQKLPPSITPYDNSPAQDL